MYMYGLTTVRSVTRISLKSQVIIMVMDERIL
jgi:hypothetical protein